jgi:hypothetical protein
MPVSEINGKNLSQFSGTEEYYFNPIFRSVRYTDGVQFLGANGASWLVTDMLAVLVHEPKVKREEFVSVTITTKQKDDVTTAKVVYDNGNGKIIYTQDYDGTDFPLRELKFFYTNNVLMLASEY